MLEIYLKLLPVFGWFMLGVGLKSFKLARDSHGAALLKFMFFVTLPILIMVKLTQTPLTMSKAYLPFMNIGINLLCLLSIYLLTRKMAIARGSIGVMLVSCMITNNFFMFPFILSVLGDAALVDAMIFDIGNAVTTITIAYALAFKYGPAELELKNILYNMVRLPAMWAVVMAITLNLNAIQLPAMAVTVLEPIGLLTNPFVLIALGIYFNASFQQFRLSLLTVGVRMGLGLVIGTAFVLLLDIQGVAAMVVILCGAAPIGFNGLTFSSLAKLDMQLASSAVSLSILSGLITIPLLMYVLQAVFKL